MRKITQNYEFSRMYIPCFYCRNLLYSEGNFWELEKSGFFTKQDSNWKYIRISLGGKRGTIDMFKDCEKFEPSGFEVHPDVRLELNKINPLCDDIPVGDVDNSIYETGEGFVRAVKEKSKAVFPEMIS